MGNSEPPALKGVENMTMRIDCGFNEDRLDFRSTSYFGWWINQWFSLRIVIPQGFHDIFTGENSKYTKDVERCKITIGKLVEICPKIVVYAYPVGLLSSWFEGAIVPTVVFIRDMAPIYQTL